MTAMVPASFFVTASTEGASALHVLQPGAQNQKATGLPAKSAPWIVPPSSLAAVNCNVGEMFAGWAPAAADVAAAAAAPTVAGVRTIDALLFVPWTPLTRWLALAPQALSRRENASARTRRGRATIGSKLLTVDADEATIGGRFGYSRDRFRHWRAHFRSLDQVSTRRLIITALVCGMAILAAGTVLLVRLVRNRDALTVQVYDPGQLARVGDALVKVVTASERGGQLQVDVVVDRGAANVGAPAAMPADTAWSLLASSVRPRIDPAGLAADRRACRDVLLEPGRVTTCTLAFAPVAGHSFAAFSWMGQQAQWRLAPSPG